MVLLSHRWWLTHICVLIVNGRICFLSNVLLLEGIPLNNIGGSLMSLYQEWNQRLERWYGEWNTRIALMIYWSQAKMAYIHMGFVNTYCWIKTLCFNQILTKIVPMGPTNDNTPLIQAMVWRRTDSKLIPGPMPTILNYACINHQAPKTAKSWKDTIFHQATSIYPSHKMHESFASPIYGHRVFHFLC